MAREDLHFRLRLPEHLKLQIESSADQSRRSMTAEIVARLEASFTRDADVEHLQTQLKMAELRAESAEANGIVLPGWLQARVTIAAAQKGRDLRQEVIQALEALYPPPPTTFGQFMEVLRDAFAEDDVSPILRPVFEGLLQSYEEQARRDPDWVNKYPRYPVPPGAFPMNFEPADEK